MGVTVVDSRVVVVERIERLVHAVLLAHGDDVCLQMSVISSSPGLNLLSWVEPFNDILVWSRTIRRSYHHLDSGISLVVERHHPSGRKALLPVASGRAHRLVHPLLIIDILWHVAVGSSEVSITIRPVAGVLVELRVVVELIPLMVSLVVGIGVHRVARIQRNVSSLSVEVLLHQGEVSLSLPVNGVVRVDLHHLDLGSDSLLHLSLDEFLYLNQKLLRQVVQVGGVFGVILLRSLLWRQVLLNFDWLW